MISNLDFMTYAKINSSVIKITCGKHKYFTKKFWRIFVLL